MQASATHQNVPAFDGLCEAVATAIAIGVADRQAATVTRAHHEARLVDSDRLTEEAPLRYLSVMGDVPNKIRKAVGITMTWDHDIVVPVMELSVNEYPGPIPRSPFQQPEETLSRSQLCFAAPLVFAALEKAGLEPHLKYVYNGDIRRYSLQIAVRVKAGS